MLHFATQVMSNKEIHNDQGFANGNPFLNAKSSLPISINFQPLLIT